MKPVGRDWLVYEGEDIAEELTRCDKRFRRNAAIACAAGLALVLLSIAGQLFRPELDELLTRSSYGGGVRDIVLRLGMDIDGHVFNEDAYIRVLEADLQEGEADRLFAECLEELPAMLAESFGDGKAVTSDMQLPSEWKGLVTLSWHSEDPETVSDDGRLMLPLSPDDRSVHFTVQMNAGGYIGEGIAEIPLDPSAADPAVTAERAAEDISSMLSADSRGSMLKLPENYRGIELDWSAPGISFPTAVIPLLVLVLLSMYFSKYDSARKVYAGRLAAFEASVPDLSLRLVLMLNAGLVVSSALDELIVRTEDDVSPLFVKMREIKRRCDASNSDFVAEFSEYAASTGNRDLTRVAAMIYENSGRGSELAEKLEAERSRQWYERLNSAKARAGEAETKLCLPLMILLVVLVIIAAAPALMNM